MSLVDHCGGQPPPRSGLSGHPKALVVQNPLARPTDLPNFYRSSTPRLADLPKATRPSTTRISNLECKRTVPVRTTVLANRNTANRVLTTPMPSSHEEPSTSTRISVDTDCVDLLFKQFDTPDELGGKLAEVIASIVEKAPKESAPKKETNTPVRKPFTNITNISRQDGLVEARRLAKGLGPLHTRSTTPTTTPKSQTQGRPPIDNPIQEKMSTVMKHIMTVALSRCGKCAQLQKENDDLTLQLNTLEDARLDERLDEELVLKPLCK